jgi:cytoskeletal protein CcmA (bactofilin family)
MGDSKKVSGEMVSKSAIAMHEAGKEKLVEGNLVMNKDTVFFGPLMVNGDILGRRGEKHALVVFGDLKARGEIDVERLIVFGDVHARELKECPVIIRGRLQLDAWSALERRETAEA